MYGSVALKLALNGPKCGNHSVLFNVPVGFRRDRLEWVVRCNMQGVHAKRRPEQVTEVLAEDPTAGFALLVRLGHLLAERERDLKCAYIHVGRVGPGDRPRSVVYTLQES
jgi:hypothetical protein